MILLRELRLIDKIRFWLDHLYLYLVASQRAEWAELGDVAALLLDKSWCGDHVICTTYLPHLFWAYQPLFILLHKLTLMLKVDSTISLTFFLLFHTIIQKILGLTYCVKINHTDLL